MSELAAIGVRTHQINRLPLLCRALWSIAGQSYENVHVVIACQGFAPEEANIVEQTARRILETAGIALSVLTVDNPHGRDLRAHLLNRIVAHSTGEIGARFLSFLDDDDLLFSHAIETLAAVLSETPAVLAYGDVHCADVFMDGGAFYVRRIIDKFLISKKLKVDLIRDNFLPLHAYMVDVSRVERTQLWFDEDLARLEDYDWLLRLAAYPWTPRASSNLIGLYNFYEAPACSPINTTANIFDSASGQKDEAWEAAKRRIAAHHGASELRSFVSDGIR